MNKTLLMILDGWGNSSQIEGNAVLTANTPVWDKLISENPTTEIATSGQAVGLPEGQMGNSEVGHMNIGAGRVVFQSLAKIQNALKEHQFKDNKVLVDACNVTANKAMHIIGLVSPGGVHSHQEHIEVMIKLAKEKGVKNIYLHAITDGRDVAPRSAVPFLENFVKLEDDNFKIATVTGRYYAMDRDNNWDRVELAYNAIAKNKSEVTANNALEALENSYKKDKNDEFVSATVLSSAKPIENGDTLVFMNFRADRARELTKVFFSKEFDGFKRDFIKLDKFVTMTQYQDELKTNVAFPAEELKNVLGEVLANRGINQLRIAETEKYAHVTYFFNGGEEQVFEHEDRILINSPKVATYDLQPEMSAPEVTNKLVEAIELDKYRFICVNYANPDMVGHTGIFEAAVKAIEAVDECLGRVIAAAKTNGFNVLITADHGNAEQMINYETGGIMTSHTVNPVPLVLISDNNKSLNSGSLFDLAPTSLALMGEEIPAEMTGKSLLE